MVLCELELVIKRVKISTTPDRSVMDLFFITDTRELLHTKSRQEDAYSHLKAVLGDVAISCDIQLVVTEMATSSQGNTFLPPDLAEEMFSLEMPKEPTSVYTDQKNVSVTMDNYLSPAHTLIQIQCEDHKGLLYDIMRTLKDYNIQISYGRFNTKQRRKCEVDLFVVQADGKKVVDPNKQTSLCSRLTDPSTQSDNGQPGSRHRTSSC
ncbi:hypothetical protein MKX01_027377 [Papaver californicum]|nr:hypothetical protein MKX01_027377 [Papaver californicum]